MVVGMVAGRQLNQLSGNLRCSALPQSNQCVDEACDAASRRAVGLSWALDRTVLGKDGLSLFQMRSEALLCLGTREPKHLERRGGVKDWAVHAEPIVKRVFGPTDCALRAVG